MLKLSFTTIATPDLSGTEAIKLARACGYGGVDLRVSDYKGELTQNSSISDINQLKNVFKSEGIEPSGLFCYNVKAGYDNASWQDMEDSILRHMEIAYNLGSPSIRMFAGDPLDFDNSDDYIKRTADTIARVLHKHDSGIKILIQNHKGGFTVIHSDQAIKMVDNPRFKLAFSPDHCLIQNEDLPTVYSKAGSITGQLYVADIQMLDDGKTPPKFPGTGDVDIKSAYQAIGGKDFNEWVTFKWEKIWHHEIEDAEVVLPRFVEYFTNLYENM